MKSRDLFFYIVIYFALCVSAATFAFVQNAEATVEELRAENAAITEERDQFRDDLWWLLEVLEQGNADGQVAREPMPDAEYIPAANPEEPIEAVAVAVYAEPNPWRTIEDARITTYCPCEICCGEWADGITKTGTIAAQGRTVAVDPKVIPLGSEVEIDGRIYIAEDTGVKGKTVDIFMNDHDAALRWGARTMTIRWRDAA